MYGEATTSLGLTKYTYSFGGHYIYLGGSTVNTGNDQADFIQAQYNADTNYRNDTTIAFWDSIYDAEWRPHVAYENYYGDRGSFRFGGYRNTSLTYSPKADIKLARLGVDCNHHYRTGWSSYVYIDSRELFIKPTESGSSFGSGQSLANMSSDIIHPCAEGNKNPGNYVYYDVDLNYIHNMVTNNFYAWYHVPFQLLPWRGLGNVPFVWYERITAPAFTLEVYV